MYNKLLYKINIKILGGKNKMTALFSKTISITIPVQLEEELVKEAARLGISRSRFIGNLLLDWQKTEKNNTNNCAHQSNDWCAFFNIECKAPQTEAETCVGFYAKEVN